jgi:O-antigen/teichoic acid export membrane protein
MSAPRAGLGRMAGRAGWALGDQALSSLINFAVGVMVARSVDPDGFGAFTLAFSTYLIVLNVARAIATQPLVIRYSAATPERWRRAVASAGGTLVLIGVVAGLPIALVGAVLPAPLGLALLALSVALTPLLVQDGWRSALFAAGLGRSAFAVDLLYAAVVIPAVELGNALGLAQPAGAILLWGLASLPSSLLGVRLAGTRPLPARTLAWLREHRDLAPRYAAETGVGLMAAQGAIYVVGAVAGLAAAGSIRGAQLLLGPLHVLIQAAYLFAVPDGVRLRTSHPERFVPAMVAVSGALALVTLGWLGALLAMPVALGRELLGPSWETTRGVLLPLGLSLTGQSLAAGSVVGLRVLADARSSLRARLLDAPAGFVLATTGALLAGAAGAAWGFAAGGLASAVIFAIAFARSVSRARAHPIGHVFDQGQPVPPAEA